MRARNTSEATARRPYKAIAKALQKAGITSRAELLEHYDKHSKYTDIMGIGPKLGRLLRLMVAQLDRQQWELFMPKLPWGNDGQQGQSTEGSRTTEAQPISTSGETPMKKDDLAYDADEQQQQPERKPLVFIAEDREMTAEEEAKEAWVETLRVPQPGYAPYKIEAADAKAEAMDLGALDGTGNKGMTDAQADKQPTGEDD